MAEGVSKKVAEACRTALASAAFRSLLVSVVVNMPLQE